MPGPRDTDWSHVRVVGGDREAGAPYLSYGRKLLGFVKQEAARNRLGTHSVTKELPDGAVVTAEIHGTIPRVTIAVPRSGGEKPLQGLDRFVVYARGDVDSFEGIDPDWPEQWLDVPGVTRQDGWMTRFHDPGMDAYVDFAGNKGIYETIEGRRAFPAGMLHHGNIDHYGKNGYRVSWYGPSCRIFADGYINPAVVWRRKVFLHGAELLDTQAYEAASPDTGTLGDTAVYGAGLAGLHLYVIQGTAVNIDTFTPPDFPPESGFIVAAEAYFSADQVMALCRYKLVPMLGGIGERVTLRVIPNSREVLWQESWEDKAIQPWFFNPDCTQACSGGSVNDPFAYSGVIINRLDAVSGSGFEFTDPAGAPAPAITHDEHYTLAIAGNAASLTTEAVSVPAGGGSAALARDYDKDGNLVVLETFRGSIGGEAGMLAFQLEGQQWPLQARTGDHAIVRHYLLHADLPQRTLIFARCDFTYADPVDNAFGYTITGGAVEVQVWRRGELVDTIPVSAAALETGLPHLAPLTQAFRGASLWSAMNTVPIPPSMAVHGNFWIFSRDTHTDPEKQNQAIGIFGGGPMFAFLAYPTAYSFGWYRFIGGSNSKYVTDRSTLYDHEIDNDGSYTPFAASTLGEHSIFSGYPLLSGDEYASLAWPTAGDDSLPALTGIAGSRVRYHPLWRLGRFDLSPA